MYTNYNKLYDLITNATNGQDVSEDVSDLSYYQVLDLFEIKAAVDEMIRIHAEQVAALM